MKNKLFCTIFSAFCALNGLFLSSASAQVLDRWQQKVNYQMEIDVDTKTNIFKGKQKLVYTNNSPDALEKVFYHLYFNAFQPGSMMDVRSRTLPDPDQRVKDRIFNLKPEETGHQIIKSLKQNGKNVSFEVVGTILEVKLNEPIKAKSSVTFEMEYESQIPLQVRRTGRDSKEGIRYSAAQWYPKMAEYDQEGWNANPYVGREFYGVFGDFDVKITIDSSYTLGGTGVLQNPQEIGHGYEKVGSVVKKSNNPKNTWHFKASNVHDFMWAGDPDYIHTQTSVDGIAMHFFFQPNTRENWSKLPEYMVKAFQMMNKKYGKYPYEQFSFMQGGDGGMEYPMSTLILGEHKELEGLVGVAVHEAVHNWYYGVLATNESLYPWMDEGFTTHAEDDVMNVIFNVNAPNPYLQSYQNYFNLVATGNTEPLTTHADHYKTNRTYSTSAYSFGAVFINQLIYVIGEKAFEKGILDYFNAYKFKHPTPSDFKRIMEKASGLELDWYLEYWIGTTKTIDYGIRAVNEKKGGTEIVLERIGLMPMPLDVVVTYKNGQSEKYYIPLQIMRGEKQEDLPKAKTILMTDWGWVYPEYTFTIKKDKSEIASIEIDPSMRMADTNRANNAVPYVAPTPQGRSRNDLHIKGKKAKVSKESKEDED